MNVIEIGGFSEDPVGKRLSNFYDRPFVLDGVQCTGIEGLLQSLKCFELERQREICTLSGKEAKRAGRAYNTWKEQQKLFWNGDVYDRRLRGYMLFIVRVYNAVYEQDASYRADLLALGDAQIWHSIGNPDMRDTTLTETELLCQLERLRHRALREAISRLAYP